MWVAVRGRGRGEFLSLENDSGPAIRFVFGNVTHREDGQSKRGSGDRFRMESLPPSSLHYEVLVLGRYQSSPHDAPAQVPFRGDCVVGLGVIFLLFVQCRGGTARLPGIHFLIVTTPVDTPVDSIRPRSSITRTFPSLKMIPVPQFVLSLAM